jgi:hypothetical protein
LALGQNRMVLLFRWTYQQSRALRTVSP